LAHSLWALCEYGNFWQPLNASSSRYSVHHDLNLGDTCDFPRVVYLNTHYKLHNGKICPDESCKFHIFHNSTDSFSHWWNVYRWIRNKQTSSLHTYDIWHCLHQYAVHMRALQMSDMTSFSLLILTSFRDVVAVMAWIEFCTTRESHSALSLIMFYWSVLNLGSGCLGSYCQS